MTKTVHVWKTFMGCDESMQESPRGLGEGSVGVSQKGDRASPTLGLSYHSCDDRISTRVVDGFDMPLDESLVKSPGRIRSFSPTVPPCWLISCSERQNALGSRAEPL